MCFFSGQASLSDLVDLDAFRGEGVLHVHSHFFAISSFCCSVLIYRLALAAIG